MCDSIIVMNGGKVLYAGSMEGIAFAAGGGEDVQTLEQAYFAIIEGARGYASRE